MEAPSIPGFGDLLALARRAWIARMRAGLADGGYPDYRRSDALVMRLLARGPLPIGRLGEALGVTRQAARKVADGLRQREFAELRRGARDSRQVTITLTPAGERYARAVVAVIAELNREAAELVGPGDLAVAARVLRAVVRGGAGGSAAGSP